MLMQQTLSQLRNLKLDGMARAFEEQAALTASTSLSFEDRFGMVVERELAWRDTRRLERLMKAARLKNPTSLHRGHRRPAKPRLGPARGCHAR